LYVTRRNARHRRVKNEPAVDALLREFGFEVVELETLSLRDQVKLFQEVAFVAGPHGAGLVTTVFSGPLTLLVFYATTRPPNYFHTQAKALGQRHLYLLGDAAGEDEDFSVDLAELRAALERELRT
jgi:capsular polysaccharide biosynthesis protein